MSKYLYNACLSLCPSVFETVRLCPRELCPRRYREKPFISVRYRLILCTNRLLVPFRLDFNCIPPGLYVYFARLIYSNILFLLTPCRGVANEGGAKRPERFSFRFSLYSESLLYTTAASPVTLIILKCL